MPDAQTKRPTLNDVARLAGVSYQTVSRVINNHPNVARRTRDRVVAAIRSLDYRPNQAAQVLATGRSHTLQLLTYDLEYYEPLSKMVHAAKQLGYAMTVAEFRYDVEKIPLLEALESLSTRMIDGVVIITPYTVPTFDEMQEASQALPLVVTGTKMGAQVPSVVFDQRAGTELALNHILSLGHRQIAEISGPREAHPGRNYCGHWDAVIRHQTLQDQLAAHGLTPGSSVQGDFSIEGGYRAAQALLTHKNPFTAIVVGNDRMALGALRALREHSIRVPDDVSVVGYDDMSEAAYFDPPLTTVRQDLTLLCRESVQYLIAMIDDHATSIHQRVLYPELVVRESTRAIEG